MMKSILAISALAAAFFGSAFYNASETHRRYSLDTTLGGSPVVVEHDYGALGLPIHEPKIVGYFGGGKPRVVAFGCEGFSVDAVVIAVEEDALPSCKRVERIDA